MQITADTETVVTAGARVGDGSGKAGVDGLVLPIARDLMYQGIRSNSILPGIFATPPMRGVPPDVLGASVPFPKRLGHAHEISGGAPNRRAG
jgi:NAD(P)-dependent dehydrogenase (short-subunit alcohol dehydrogenase family)